MDSKLLFSAGRSLDQILTDDECREARDNIRTFFELLDRWDREHDVTVVSDISTIENCEHTEGGHNE